jgi:hypothetical protein
MATKTAKPQPFTNDEIRQIMLKYFYGRNKNATSRMGKSGAAVKISTVRADLKASYSLGRTDIISNLTYLLSQGWVEEKPLSKTFTTPRGGLVPAVTPYYVITAAGIDKIEGPSEFTRDRFQGIRIEATGQNIITLGDGNQVNVRFREAGEALAEFRKAVKSSPALEESAKVDLVADIDSMQDQLAKPHPNRTVVQALWAVVEKGAAVAGLADAAMKVAPHIAGLLK